VEPVFGHETNEPNSCKKCGHSWETKREKATDINLALAVFQDAVDDAFDVAFIVSADTDQAATFAHVKKRWPAKKLFTVVPPKREPSKHLYTLADGKKKLQEKDIHAAIFGKCVTDGTTIVTRPSEYDPPWQQPGALPS